MTDDDQRLRRALRQSLESLQRSGLTHLPKPPPGAAATAPSTEAAAGDPIANPPAAAPPRAARTAAPANLFQEPSMEGTVLPVEQRPAALQVIAQEVAVCTRCSELAATRTQTVFGVGDPAARLCFMGEAPGADEDRQGEPFVGRAGQLLNKIIEACTLKREDVYILNTLKCRPPGNRNPAPEEAANCREYLDRQLDVIRPEFICCLGAVAAQNLLSTTQSIGRMRGRFHDYRGIRVMCTYHPAYLLRNPAAKKDTWEDMQMLMEAMDIPLPQKKRKAK